MPDQPTEIFVDALGSAPDAKPGDFPAATRVLTADGATIVVFTFTDGQRLDDHHAPHPLVAQVLSGRLTFTVGDRDHDLTPGSFLYVPEGAPHSLHAEHGDVVFQLLLST